MILAIWLSVHWDWRLLVWIVVSFGSVGCTLVNSLALRIWDGFLWFGSVYLVLLSSFLFIIDSFGSVFSARCFQFVFRLILIHFRLDYRLGSFGSFVDSLILSALSLCIFLRRRFFY